MGPDFHPHTIMTEWLELLLRIAGAGLILLAILHVPIGRRLRWSEDAMRLMPVNRSIFHVHTFFICLVLLLMGLPCLLDPSIFTATSRAGAWLSWSISTFWATRLYFQWFVYPADLWRGKRMETVVHACGLLQAGWISG